MRGLNERLIRIGRSPRFQNLPEGLFKSFQKDDFAKNRHCEIRFRRVEAIPQGNKLISWDCFVASLLAMTAFRFL
jgi:hypothetical protein